MGQAHELRLLFEESDGNCRIRLSCDAGQSEAVPFEPFLSEDDYGDLQWYLEDYMDLPDGGSVVRARRVERSLDDWGRRLYAAVFDNADHRELLSDLAEADPPRLLTIATNDTDLLRLPWELMADKRGPLTRRPITIRRQLETALKPPEHHVTLPLRILLVVSRPDDAGFIDPRHTTRGMLDVLEDLAENVIVDFCRPPTLPTMERMLSDANRRGEPYHIFHFDGHGTFLPEIGLGALCFEKPSSEAGGKVETDYVRADRLGEILSTYNVPLAILEACRSGQIGKVAAFRSVAPRLIEAGVGSVLSMSHAVHVEATRVLLERFYRELVRGLTIGQALEEGRAALMANPFRWLERGPEARSVELTDWFLPHLYQRGSDITLVPEPEAVEAPKLLAQIDDSDREIQFDVFLSHNHADSDRVERIATQLKDQFQLRVFLDKWLMQPGPLHKQCRDAVKLSRFVLVCCSQEALQSDWVGAEIDMAHAIDPRGRNIIPLLLEDVELPVDLDALLWFDFRDATRDAQNTADLAGTVRSAIADNREPPTARREPAAGDELGAFPRPPLYQFHGRAPELHALEREFRSFRAILLHAMGGMGKTALAREAAFWWTRTGLFPDGACFVSFERGGGADQIALVLGTYLEGHEFERLPAEEQRERAKELFEQKRVLMVWDNFESVLPAFQNDEAEPVVDDEERSRILDLFQDWTESPDGQGRLLITCRPAEAGLAAARRMELEGLARPDSLSLLARVMKTHGVELTDERLSKEGLAELLTALRDHPLSIELVGPHLAEMTPEQVVADFGRLLAEFKRGEGKERNESLLASLAFSTRRLSGEAQAALPWLGLFSGGVFEQTFLAVSEMEADAWESVRAELEATALVRVERDILFGDRPYIRFHPTLSYAAKRSDVPDPAAARARFVEVYVAVRGAAHKALRGSNPDGGMAVMAREEANVRTAVRLALESEAYGEASRMGSTFAVYLQMSARRERDSWVKWLAREVGKAGFTAEAAAYECHEAWSLFTQGHAQQAIDKLEALIQRLQHTTEFDPAFQSATAQGVLGRTYCVGGQAGPAIPILESAAKQWSALVESKEAAEQPSETERGNLAATLGDLANALRSTGQLGEAMEAAEQGIEIVRALGREREVAVGLGRTAKILMAQGRYQDADKRFGKGLEAARRAGDKDLVGVFLQNQGMLAGDMQQHDRATDLYKRALELFQDANNEEGVMQTCNLLGVVEQNVGRLSEAREWYGRSREIAKRRGDSTALGTAAQNIGIVCQQEGKTTRETEDEAKAEARLREAVRFVTESLSVWTEADNRPYEAASHSQLAQVYLLLGELAEAETHAQQALEIREGLGLKEVHRDYHIMADIARARGNESEAAEWERKRDEMLEELERRARGDGGSSRQMLKAITALAVECARAGVDGSDLSPEAESAIAQCEQLSPPLDSLAPLLRDLAAGQLPAVPSSLPDELREMLGQIVEAVREAKG